MEGTLSQGSVESRRYLMEPILEIRRIRTLRHSNGRPMANIWQLGVTMVWHEFGLATERYCTHCESTAGPFSHSSGTEEATTSYPAATTPLRSYGTCLSLNQTQWFS